MRLKDIKFDPPNHPFAVDVLRNQSTHKGDTLTCIKCKEKYQRGIFDFYSLCNKCFAEFDSQKMKGRFSFGKIPYYENAQQWIESLN